MWIWAKDGERDALLNTDHVVKIRPTTSFSRLQAFDKDGATYIIDRGFFALLEELNGENDEPEEQE